MGGDQTLIAIGVGCRKFCPADDIVALVREALAALPAGAEPGSLFSIAAKRAEPGLAEAAATLGLALAFFEADALRAFADGASHVSERVIARHDLPSVAETAALAGAGHGSVLLVARRASSRATCAIAGPPIRSAP